MKKKENKSGSRTLLMALLLSAPGPLVTGFAALTSGSATQIADFLRRTSELAATFMSWWVYRQINRHPVSALGQTRLEKQANMTVAGAMICSGIAMLIVGIYRLSVFKANGNVTMGLVIALLGLITNGAFMFKYRALLKAEHSPVIEGQMKLYRAKVSVDLCVTLALSAVAIAPTHPITRYVDAIGSIAVSVYLLRAGVLAYRKVKAEPNES